MLMANTLELDHVSLFVHDLGTSARFYSEVLGLPEIEKKMARANVRWFGLGAGRAVHLILGAAEVPASRPQSTHFALATSSFDETVRQLADFGVALQDLSGMTGRGFEICIDALSFWLMRIAREIGCGTSVQALRERRACQKWADAHQAALPV